MQSALRSRVVNLIAVVAVAGCGSGSTALRPSVPFGSPPASPPAGAVADSGIPVSNPPLVARSPLPLSTATPAPDADHELKSVPWTLTGKRDGGRTLVISYSAGGCSTDAGVHVTQTSSYVMVAAYNLVAKPSRTPIPCPQYALLAAGTVILDEPLGNRTLYHAPLG